MDLVTQILNGDRLALARVLTHIENDTQDGRAALATLFPHAGKAHLIGVTGAPGTGKSSLVNQLALYFRKQNKRVAIVAVDPSSPFTGGAVLGDRVRMRDLSGDAGIFIRSMATRGSLGGLAQATAGMTQVFDAAGFEIVMIETVGAGQSEVDIARLAHTTLVVEAPGLGDDIQAIKAGILEIADILVVNKADRPGVENTEKALKSMLELSHPTQHIFSHHGKYMSAAPQVKDAALWIPPIQRTISIDGTGIPELAEQIAIHAEHLRVSGDWAARERARLESEMDAVLQETLVSQFRERVPESKYDEVMMQVYKRSLSPREAVKMLTNGRAK
ncbi:MAG: methylmalonyl Co-A mutase-associated GTPase MeaB [Chloroflexi bacterium]|nr:methylmalonyl Co-A mutase-associated GTPase MeaB [Chloroflexota bacterium]MBI3341437.1 methylmalonyl Co-A mutase-associated GTPase MeaB [Chloroflexota bacterium]